MSTETSKQIDVVYPESDGKPMADNTLQWDWMVKIVGELREQYAGQEVFVAGDLFWYPIEGDPKTVSARTPWSSSAGRRGIGGVTSNGLKPGLARKSCSRCCPRATPKRR